MGSNESFPPPPPPGQPPQPANWPPQQPGYQPTQQVPATQMYPQQGYVPEATPPKKGNGLLIGGGLVVVAALVGAVVLLMGGDDDKKDTTVTLAPVTSSTLGTATTIGGQITTPPTVGPTDPGTVPETTTAGDFVTINDDTGTFAMVLPDDLEFDTTTIQSTDDVPVIIPSISAAEVIDDYNHDDTTFGLTAVSVGPLIGSTPEQVLAFLEPADGTCTGRVQDTLETTQGLATRVSLTGCGAGGGNKVLLVVQLTDRAVVLGLYMQGTTDTATLSPAAQYALESMFVF